jgi:hypothetical protein
MTIVETDPFGIDEYIGIMSAVACNADATKLSLWIESDFAQPVVVSNVVANQTVAAARTLLYLRGIHVLLEYAISVGIKRLRIHIADLTVYNYIVRFAPVWKKNGWVTTRNQPIPNEVRTMLESIERLMMQLQYVKLRNLSPSFARSDSPLQHANHAL